MLLLGPLPSLASEAVRAALHPCHTCKLLLECINFNLAGLPCIEEKVVSESGHRREGVQRRAGCGFSRWLHFSGRGLAWPVWSVSGKRTGETGCGMPRCLSWHNKQPYFYPSSPSAFVASTATRAVSVSSLLACLSLHPAQCSFD